MYNNSKNRFFNAARGAKQTIFFSVALSMLLLTSACKRDTTTTTVIPQDCTGLHWSYSATSEEGPSHWADMCVANAACNGVAQSPIDLNNAENGAGLGSLPMTINSSAVSVTNNGHTLQWTYDAGSRLMIGSDTFSLLQFHFHAPSEHKLNGVSFPLEIHLVHKNATTGKLAVVGVFFKEGAENPLLKKLLVDAPAKEGTVTNATTFTVADLLPANKSYFRYGGSLTTPPCSEIVTWTVMETPIEASAAQIQQFVSIFGSNNRPIQQLNGRSLSYFKG